MDGNNFKVINYIKLEKYLNSVVGSEMPKSWPAASLKAQAIAARTYVLKELNKNKNYLVYSSVNSPHPITKFSAQSSA